MKIIHYFGYFFSFIHVLLRTDCQITERTWFTRNVPKIEHELIFLPSRTYSATKKFIPKLAFHYVFQSSYDYDYVDVQCSHRYYSNLKFQLKSFFYSV